jgi:mannose-6-phosphate isomerase-like protein (cupin superfamily)
VLRRMAKFLQFRVLILSAVIFLAAFCSAVAQQFTELPSNRDTGVSIDRFIGSWKYSEPVVTHGSLVERAILRPGDPYKPRPPGAVLEFHKDFGLGTLQPGGRTLPARHDEEEIVYIESGSGRIESGGDFWPLKALYGVLIPPHVEHVLVNGSDQPMSLLVLTDLLEPAATPRSSCLGFTSLTTRLSLSIPAGFVRFRRFHRRRFRGKHGPKEIYRSKRGSVHELMGRPGNPFKGRGRALASSAAASLSK